MSEKIKVAVFSPNDPRSWVREKNIDLMLKHESSLIRALRDRNVEVIRGGDGESKQDQLAWNTSLMRRHISRITRENPDALIINQGSWTFPYDSVDAVKYFMHERRDIARVVMFSYKDTRVPGLVAGMASGGGLKRIGVPFQSCYGVIDKDPKVATNLMDILQFYKKRSEVADTVKSAIDALSSQKYLALGGMSIRMPTTTADVDQWQKLFGISYEALDQSEIKIRALDMVEWVNKPGESSCRIVDKRVKKAVDYLYEGNHGHFDFSSPHLKSIDKFVYQVSMYYAGLDICRDLGITFAGIKCQDELSARDCTACIFSSYLSNDIGPDGEPKEIIPVACENDMDSALTQLWMYLLTNKPAGFGDFRDVENGILTIMNCGQHPIYFFGNPDENSVEKLNKAEYMGQGIFYPAGGSTVKGVTPAGNKLTVARLGRENLRYQLISTVIETVEVSAAEHKRYDFSWPIIRGKIPISDELLIDVWPCNHLAFAFGDLTPHLMEMAHRLDIGYRVFDEKGREYSKAS